MKTCTFVSYVAQFFLEQEMFQTNAAQKIKTHFMCYVSFYEILIFYKIRWGKYGTAKQTTNDRIIQRTHCVLDNYAYKHTLRICNSYCFSTVTMVRQKRFKVTFYALCQSFLYPGTYKKIKHGHTLLCVQQARDSLSVYRFALLHSQKI